MIKKKRNTEFTKEQELIFKCVKALSDLSENYEEVTKDKISDVVENKYGYTPDKLEDIQNKEDKTDLEKLLLNYMAAQSDLEQSKVTNMNYIKPNALTMPTPKPVEQMFDGVDLRNKTDIIVSAINAKERYVVPTQVVVLPESENSAVNINRKLTVYDRSVFNGICSIYKTGNKAFTVKQVYHAMGGKGNPKPETLDTIKKSIMKLRATFVSVDWSDQLRMYGFNIAKDITFKTDAAMLSCEGVQLKLKGKEVSGYKFISELPLLTYANSVDQICTVDREMLEAPVWRTEENIVLIQFLARWLNYNKAKNAGKSIALSYRYIFQKTGMDIEKTESRKRNRKIEAIHKIMTYWTAKKYISGFSEYIAKQSFGGITVEFNEAEDESEEIKDYSIEE